MIAKWVKDIPNWEKEYLKTTSDLSRRQKEILEGDDIKSHEGMLYGEMYAAWKRSKILYAADMSEGECD
jgi:hypothetical protein|tara:strand:- start:6315 stop:6521 length:207 start_codon:yes stop_codon:yes gene_type:complete